MKICNLASGSKGNMTYVEAGDTKFLVDLGLSCKEAERRLELIGVNPIEISGIIVTHEHTDHTKGIECFSKKYGTKIYANNKTWINLSRYCSGVPLNQRIDFFDVPFTVENFSIEPFRVSHDVACCNGFSFYDGNRKASIATDLGVVNDEIRKSVSGSSIVFLESNHDEEMLKHNPNYSNVLKRRILSTRGHLSNTASGNLSSELIKSGTKQIVLSHLSEENNFPELAFKTVCEMIESAGITENEYKLAVASQSRPTAMYVLKKN